MEWSKVKTILIVVLLVVNIFLAANLTYIFVENGRISNSTAENLIGALKQNGVHIDKGIITMGLNNFFEVEPQNVKITLPDNLEKNIKWTSDGGFEYRSSLAADQTEDRGGWLVEHLGKQGFTVSDYKTDVSESQAGYWIALNRYFLSKRVLNTTIMANISKNELLCWGRTPFYEIYPVSKIDSSVLPDVLVRFSVYIKENNNISVNVTGIEPAYEASYNIDRIESIFPVLIIKTDIGEFIYNISNSSISKKG